MTVRREKIFLYFFIFLTICLQNISAQETTDKQKTDEQKLETPKSVSNVEKKTSENPSAFNLRDADKIKGSNSHTVNFSKTDFESNMSDFRYNFLAGAVKKNRKFITDEEDEELKKRSTISYKVIIAEETADKSNSCKDKELN